MTKFNKLALVLFVAASLQSYAQTATNRVISSGGNSVTSQGNTLTYTIGETLTPTLKAANNTLTQGFNQPSNLVVSAAVSDTKNSYSVTTYPNPTQDIVNIDISGQLSTPLSMEMFDNSGKRVTPDVMQNDKSKIQFGMQGLEAGYYFVRLVNPTDQSTSTIKIAKIK